MADPRPPDPAHGRGGALVAGQLAALAAVGWPGRALWPLPRPVTAAATLVAAAGAALAAQGARDLGRDLTPFVEPRTGAGLRTTGAYAASRHPVYAGLLSGSAALAVLRRRPEPLAAVAVLAAVLHRKAGVEERRLRARFGPAYDEYAARTPRLLGLPRRLILRRRLAGGGGQDVRVARYTA